MIPADVASRLQVAADVALRQPAPAQEISDKLSDLTSGQRVLAEIQALLPNGTYRAIINQRDVTLALPFAAKAGDALELEVINTEGKLTLAVISRPAGDNTPRPPADSVSTTLSRTGQLISNLLGKAGDAQAGPTPTALNGNQPIASAPPAKAQDILPLLKQAITQSGMFYESHQAEWVDGRLDKAALLQEPQGKLSPARLDIAPGSPGRENAVLRTGAEQNAFLRPGIEHNALPRPGGELTQASTPPTSSAATADSSGNKAATVVVQSASQSTQLVAADALPLVRQQLDALATQNFSWQGQVWPGQEMRWEIEEDATHHGQPGEDAPSHWQTRLRLTLPNLGEVDAQIRLQGNQISLVLGAGSALTQDLLRTSAGALRSQLDEAGLALASMGVGAVKDGSGEINREVSADGQTTG